MLDVEMLDRAYEALKISRELPIWMGIFDKRLLMPLVLLAKCVAMEGETVTAEKLSAWLEAGLYPVFPREEEPGELGFPRYVPSRIAVLLRLERAGWTMPELRRVAEMEDWTIDECLSTDEFAYEDDDVRLLSNEIQRRLVQDGELLAYLEADPRPARLPSYWRSNVTASELREQRAKLERNLARITAPQLTEARREWIARIAFRTRAANDLVRLDVLVGERARLEQGISPWLIFRSGGRNVDGEHWFKEIVWDWTLRGPVDDADDEPLPIRLPGVILRGDDITLTRASTPHEYERLWREYRLDEYFRVRAKVRDERICQHCLKPLPEDAKATKHYCSHTCRSAAKMQRFRQNSPDKHLAIQERYWTPDELVAQGGEGRGDGPPKEA
jgi:hypothetical protein